MELYDVMRTTGATRQFTGEELPDEVLARILDNARFAPSGGNRQGNRVVVVRDAERRAALAELARKGAKRYLLQKSMGENPWNTIDPPAASAEEIESYEVPEAFLQPPRDASVVLVFCVDLSVVASMDQDLDRIGVISGASIYPFVWNVLLAARNEGFGGTITTMAVPDEPGIKALLAIPDEFAVAAVVPLGKPQKQVTKLTRRPVAEIAVRETFDGLPFG
ncbi:MAG TPA: nitroreductase family protein [Mycobacteriales bacterium]|nr:nitroreductase family protein [Mycobacteriales bacterium]